MTKKKIAQKMLDEKEEELMRYQILADYLCNRIEAGQITKRTNLLKVQQIIDELKDLVEFLKTF